MVTVLAGTIFARPHRRLPQNQAARSLQTLTLHIRDFVIPPAVSATLVARSAVVVCCSSATTPNRWSVLAMELVQKAEPATIKTLDR